MSGSSFRKIGFDFASGVALYFALWLACVLLIGSALSAACNLYGKARDLPAPDNSDVSWSKRSGMRLRHDALTGCDYFESRDGFLTPRMAADGRQICQVRK